MVVSTKKLDAVNGQWLSVPKPAGKIGSTCTKASCVKDEKKCCEKFDEKDRQNIITGDAEIISYQTLVDTSRH